MGNTEWVGLNVWGLFEISELSLPKISIYGNYERVTQIPFSLKPFSSNKNFTFDDNYGEAFQSTQLALLCRDVVYSAPVYEQKVNLFTHSVRTFVSISDVCGRGVNVANHRVFKPFSPHGT